MTLANYITLFRIILIPFFILSIVYYKMDAREGGGQEWHLWTAFALFVVAAISDGLDGYIARKYHQTSRLGAILDPLADKGLMLSGMLVLSYPGHQDLPRIPVWFLVIYLTKEIFILGGYFLYTYLNKQFSIKVHWTGKTATAMVMILISLMLLNVSGFNYTLFQKIVGAILIISLIFYMIPTWRLLKSSGQAMPGGQ